MCATLKRARKLFGKFIESECATTKVKDIVVRSNVAPQAARYRVKAVLAVLLGFEKSGFTHHTQMFGNVVLGGLQMLRNLVHAQFSLEEEPQYAQSSFLTQCFQRSNTIQSGHAEDVPFAEAERKRLSNSFPS